MPSTRFTLSEPPTQMEAHVRNVAQWAELRAAERGRFCERVGAALGKPAEEVGADLERGQFFDTTEALEYGLLDEVCRPDADVRTLPGSGSGPGTPPPIGFRPLR
jgi:ATP-dependent protease ClpP protease subunit